MTDEEKQKISLEAFDTITDLMRLYGLGFNENVAKFALAVFLAGVNFIPNKTRKK